MSLRLYKVFRYLAKPNVVVVLARDKEDAKELVNKRHGHDSCEVKNIRMIRGKMFTEQRYW